MSSSSTSIITSTSSDSSSSSNTPSSSSTYSTSSSSTSISSNSSVSTFSNSSSSSNTPSSSSTYSTSSSSTSISSNSSVSSSSSSEFGTKLYIGDGIKVPLYDNSDMWDSIGLVRRNLQLSDKNTTTNISTFAKIKAQKNGVILTLVSPPLAENILISGHFKSLIRYFISEFDAVNRTGYFPQTIIRVLSPNGSNRGTLCNIIGEFGISHGTTNDYATNVVESDLTPTQAYAGDRIQIEVGADNQAYNDGYPSVAMATKYGSDYGFNENNSTMDRDTWVGFSQELTFVVFGDSSSSSSITTNGSTPSSESTSSSSSSNLNLSSTSETTKSSSSSITSPKSTESSLSSSSNPSSSTKINSTESSSSDSSQSSSTSTQSSNISSISTSSSNSSGGGGFGTTAFGSGGFGT